MKPRHALAIALGFALTAAVAGAPQKPNFSGRWVVVSPEESKGQEQLVKHDATTLVVSHDSEGGGHVFTYKLDGSESRQVLSHGGAEIVTLAHASWTGNQITITSETDYGSGRRLTQKHIWSLNSQGRLVVDLSEQMSNAQPMSVKLVFQKK